MAGTSKMSKDEKIQRVQPQLLRLEKNKTDYFPQAVSFGPFHHGEPDLAFAEAFKPKAVELFISDGPGDKELYLTKLLNIIGEIRNSYDETTSNYSDDYLAEMMLRDASLIIIYMEISSPDEAQPPTKEKFLAMNEHLGMLTMGILSRDLLLLENQIPLRVIEALMDLRYGAGQYEALVTRYLNIDFFGEHRQKTVLSSQSPPLHLLEAIYKLLVSDCIDETSRHCNCTWRCCFTSDPETGGTAPRNTNAIHGLIHRLLKCKSTGGSCCFTSDPETGGTAPRNTNAIHGLIHRSTGGSCCFTSDPETGGTAPRNTNADHGLIHRSTGGSCCFTSDPETGGTAPRNTNADHGLIHRSTGGSCCFTSDPETGGTAPRNTNADHGLIHRSTGGSCCFTSDPETGGTAPRNTNANHGLIHRLLNCKSTGGSPDQNIKKFIHSFRSATSLKAKGIYFKPSPTRSLKDVTFQSHFFYATLRLPEWGVTNKTRVTFTNLIAYELSPNSQTVGVVLSYVNFMKSLIEKAEDAKELRERKILYNMLGGDEQVLRVYREIDTHGADNPSTFLAVRDKIQAHYNSKVKTWMAELLHGHFQSPWSITAFLAAAALLGISAAQLYYAHAKS